jgi:nitroimidazol reductase NimA-like FMN-containing flavoprotein (pyridoxamine 5'-phosphate oxidase superfamily)
MIDDDVYFHCAMEGRKLSGLKNGSSVSFCAVGSTEVLPSKFGTLYESVIAEGTIEEVAGKEKQLGLEGLIRKYSPEYVPEGMGYIESKGPRARVYKISITHLSGKARQG